jgi:DNA topoisomerase-1
LPFDLSKEYESEDAITDFLDGSTRFQHMYSCSEPKKVFKAPPEPFTTSRIQQVASNELHYSPKETMSICQTLYQNGHITFLELAICT